ncbi:Di-trans-poly-cis-decaprenylcistransferase [Ramaria rubella]|nr:Di-trans-poly-cis-decaprenylcistransferase [Ramaria rubella]
MFARLVGLQGLISSIYKFLLKLLIACLTSGPIPKHVAFVMDGNRRYARKRGKSISEGYSDGFAALYFMLIVSAKLGIHSISAYAFSIDNFKRAQDEVDDLMYLFEFHFKNISQHGAVLHKYGVRVKVLGQVYLLPQKVQDAIKEMEEATSSHNKLFLNLMMPYTSRSELTTALQSTIRQALDGNLDPKKITEDHVEAELWTTLVDTPPVDILIRTSGVKRFSDYMTWQCCENTQIHFLDTHWPEIGVVDFVPILIQYQRMFWLRKHKSSL